MQGTTHGKMELNALRVTFDEGCFDSFSSFGPLARASKEWREKCEKYLHLQRWRKGISVIHRNIRRWNIQTPVNLGKMTIPMIHSYSIDWTQPPKVSFYAHYDKTDLKSLIDREGMVMIVEDRKGKYHSTSLTALYKLRYQYDYVTDTFPGEHTVPAWCTWDRCNGDAQVTLI